MYLGLGGSEMLGRRVTPSANRLTIDECLWTSPCAAGAAMCGA